MLIQRGWWNKRQEECNPRFDIERRLRTGGRGGWPLNETTYWNQIPWCHLEDVILEIGRRIEDLRVKFGTRKRILIHKIEVKSAFRQVEVDPAVAEAHGYVPGDHLFIDLRLQCGWRSPGWVGGNS